MANQQLESFLGAILNLPFLRFPPGKIAMLHYGRCGSTVLCDLVGQHPDIFWDAEIFERMFRRQLWEARFINDPILLLRARMLRLGKQYYGFETKCHPAYHLSSAVLKKTTSDYISILKQLGYDLFIILKRKNYLRQQISEEVGRQSGRVWHQPAGASAKLRQVNLDVDCVRFGGKKVSLLESFEARDQGYGELKKLLEGDRLLWLTYEDHILPDPTIGYRQICEFSSLMPQDVEIKRSRTNPFPLKDIIQNFSEVEACLESTAYRWMLYD